MKGQRSPEDLRKTNSPPGIEVFGAFRGHFELTLSISTSNCMCDACVMHTCTGLVEPKTGKVKKTIGFERIFEGSKGAKARQPNEQASEKWRFRGMSGSL